MLEGKYYSELTKQNYYSEEAKAAEEKAFQAQLEEKEKREQTLKDTREARAKEYNQAIEDLLKLHNELRAQRAEKVQALNRELDKFDKQIAEEYQKQWEKTNEIIEKFEKDYPRGYNFTVRFHSPSSAIEHFFSDFMHKFDLF